MTNVHEILDKVRSARQRLPAGEAAVLFAAAVRLAAAQGATLRGRLVQLDDSGGLHLAPFDDQGPEEEPGYLAPELLSGEATKKSEPRVQVYAAGALGYELLTGHHPPGNPAELSGPLGDIVRMALAPDRRERFGDLTQLHDAIEGVQPRPPAEGERNILASLRTRWTRAPEKEAVARIIEKLGALETQVAQIGKAQAKLEASQREALERLDRFQDGQQRLQRPAAPSFVGPVLLGGLLAAAAVVGAGWALGLVGAPVRVPVREEPVAVPAPVPPVKPAPEIPDAAVVEAKPDAGTPAAVMEQPDAAVVAVADAGAAEPAPDAGAVAAAEPAPPAPVKRRRPPEVSQAAMLHAVAISQVRRGETALEQGRADEAVASFRAALENEAALPVAFRGLGMAYAMQNSDTQALQAYQRYLQLAPGAKDRADIRRSIAELKARAKIGGEEK